MRMPDLPGAADRCGRGAEGGLSRSNGSLRLGSYPVNWIFLIVLETKVWYRVLPKQGSGGFLLECA
jgi:hypothetical protein